MRFEGNTFFLDLARVGQRKDLETARIGQDRSVIIHEGMNAAGLFQGFRTRSEPEVIGIAQNDRSVKIFDVVRGQKLDRCLGPDRHENRSIDDFSKDVQFA